MKAKSKRVKLRADLCRKLLPDGGYKSTFSRNSEKPFTLFSIHSLSKSTRLDQAVPASTISAFSSGEFVGMVADTPDQKITLKAFQAEIINDHKALKREEESYRPIPKVREITQEELEENYRSIKREVQEIIRMEMERVFDTPELGHLIIRG